MGEDTNTATEQQTPPETTAEDVEALLEAARYDDIDDVNSLASAGVSLDSKDLEGRTALHMAAANGHLGVVEYLISSGVGYLGEKLCKHLKFLLKQDVNASNAEKNTPLHWACLNGHIEVVKKLILAGANAGALNSHDRTPFDEAVSRGKLNVKDAIHEAEAQVELAGARVS